MSLGGGLAKEPASQCIRVYQNHPSANYPLVSSLLGMEARHPCSPQLLTPHNKLQQLKVCFSGDLKGTHLLMDGHQSVSFRSFLQ